MRRGAAVLALLAASCGRSGFEAPVNDDPWANLPTEPPPNDPDALVQVSGLQAMWATSQWTFWQWSATGVAGDLERFSFTVGPTWVEVVNDVGDATTTYFEGATMPADFALQNLGGLLQGDCVPDSQYVGMLVAIDNEGRRSVAASNGIRTLPEPSRELVIFRDAEPPGVSVPAELVWSTSHPYGGTTHHFAWDASCGQASCNEILRRQELELDTSFFDANTFERAFVEFAAASNSVPASLQSGIRLWFGTTASHVTSEQFAFRGWFMSSTGDYRVYQFPLAEMTHPTTGDLLTLDVARKGLYEVGLSGTWSEGSRVEIDEARIRW